MDINWFPGHMAKSLRLIQEKLSLVDLVIETCDARLPLSSRNPELHKILDNKARLLLLTKEDLADPKQTETFSTHYNKNNDINLAVNVLNRKEALRIISKARELINSNDNLVGRKRNPSKPLRIMTVGIPNSGKSTLINCLAKRKRAKVEDRPGVTRSFQWIKTDNNVDLMDMPGVLWPNLGSKETKLNLALSGAIKDDILDITELAYNASILLSKLYPELLIYRYMRTKNELTEVSPTEIENFQSLLDLERFEAMAKKRACIKKGGKIDYERFSGILLNELRQGIIGRISLDRLS